jgi:menaquinone-dependent protoporphyrinogen IX oxidase
MNIGIIVYSRAGHTRMVATKLKDALSAAGHDVALVELETVGPLPRSARTAELKTIPSVESYEAVVLACPVQGGVPAPPMRVYLEQVGSLEGKQVALFVGGFFPAAWGRNQTISALKAMCEPRGAAVCGAACVRWSSLRRQRQIAKAVDSLCALF